MSSTSALFFTAVVGAAVLLLAASGAHATPTNETYISPPNQTMWREKLWFVVRNDSNGTMNIVPFDYEIKYEQGEYAAATMIYNMSLNDLGWDYVQIEGNATLVRNTQPSLTPLAVGGGNWTGNRRDAYYLAGLLEGFVTAKRLWDVYTVQGIYPLNASAIAWIDQHIAFMKTNADAAYAQQIFPDGDFDDVFNQTFWRKVGDILAQLQGIADGVSREGTHNLTFRDVFYLNFNDEIMDVILATQDSSVSVATLRAHDRRSHCSALIKNTGSDIFFSHVTWGGYNTMVRQYKTYSFETKVSMTSIAGTIMSGDDWYMTNNSLAVQETTNEYYGTQLAKDFVVPNSVSEFIRVMVANYVAADGSRWAKLFVYNNNGCYDNQYMVLNAKLVNLTRAREEDKIPPHTLTIVEQMPGDYGVADFSASLRNNGYFASYNIPVIPKIFVNSGFAAQQQLYGTFFSHDQTPRALIFARNQSGVTDLASMKTMMRFNHWTTDPLSAIPNCSTCKPNSPWLAIASRGDLVPANATLPAAPAYAGYFAQSPNGAIDAKITSVELIKTLTGHVINGPTSDTQPVFSFSTSPFPAVRPPGSPDKFDFNWVAFTYATFLPPKVQPYFPYAATVVGVIVGLIVFVFVLYIVADKCCAMSTAKEEPAYAKL